MNEEILAFMKENAIIMQEEEVIRMEVEQEFVQTEALYMKQKLKEELFEIERHVKLENTQDNIDLLKKEKIKLGE